MSFSFINVVTVILVLLLAVIFAFAGSVKLTDQIDPALHAEISAHFPEHLRVLKLYSPVQIPINAAEYQLFVGVVEVVLAVGLVLPPTTTISSLGLFVVGVFASLTHVWEGTTDKLAFPAVLTGLAFILLLIRLRPRKAKSSKKGKKNQD